MFQHFIHRSAFFQPRKRQVLPIWYVRCWKRGFFQQAFNTWSSCF